MIQGTTKDPLGMPKEEHMDQDSLLFLQMNFSFHMSNVLFSQIPGQEDPKVSA